jgi:hypothetical protein
MHYSHVYYALELVKILTEAHKNTPHRPPITRSIDKGIANGGTIQQHWSPQDILVATTTTELIQDPTKCRENGQVLSHDLVYSILYYAKRQGTAWQG